MLNFLDIVGSIFGFLATYCYIRVNILGWPLSLIAIVIDIVLCLKKGIYGTMGLQFVYFFLSLYGWYQWKYGNDKAGLLIRNVVRKEMIILVFVAIFGFIPIFVLLNFYTDSNIPLLDSIVVIISLIAQWMSCKKIIECWYLWFTVDALLVGIYAYKGVPVHTVLFLVYTGMAIAGYINWKKQLIIKIRNFNVGAK